MLSKENRLIPIQSKKNKYQYEGLHNMNQKIKYGISLILILGLSFSILVSYSKFKKLLLEKETMIFLVKDTEDFSICNLTCFRRTETFYQLKKTRNIGFYLLKNSNVLEKFESPTSKHCLDYAKEHRYEGLTTHLGLIKCMRFYNARTEKFSDFAAFDNFLSLQTKLSICSFTTKADPICNPSNVFNWYL